MARRRASPVARQAVFITKDLTSWNFIIFLVLAFILLVIVLTAMNRVSLDMRTRAELGNCPQLSLPRAEDCPGGWTFKRDAAGCPAFICEKR